MGVDPVEMRLKNMVRADQMPFQNGLGWRLDSGDYPEALRRARESVTKAGWFDEVSDAVTNERLVGSWLRQLR